ncbi:MAG: ABC transporter permease [Vicinamibacteria bacterium]
MASKSGSARAAIFAFWESIKMGFASLVAYKMRAALTILGVVMGIMTVTGVSAIIAGLNKSLSSQLDQLGSAFISIRPFAPGENASSEERRRRKLLTDEEVKAIRDLPLVSEVSPLAFVRADLIKYKDLRVSAAQVFGTTPDYEGVHNIFVERGRFFNESETSRAAQVAVIGPDIVDAVFPGVDPLDKELSIDGRKFRVIGVTEKRGKFLFFSRDNVLLVPIKSLPSSNFMGLEGYAADIKAVSPEQVLQAEEQIRETLRRKRRLRFFAKDTFAVFTQDAITELYNQVTGGIYMVMIAISCIGLVVGGVGVMNIMLVSVTERTREIGIRKALGAKRRDILWQFLTEAMTLTGVGGILGIAIGGGLASLINALSPFPAAFQPQWVAAAFISSLFVGLFFGLWPAWKAAKLDPIEALRYE